MFWIHSSAIRGDVWQIAVITRNGMSRPSVRHDLHEAHECRATGAYGTVWARGHAETRRAVRLVAPVAERPGRPRLVGANDAGYVGRAERLCLSQRVAHTDRLNDTHSDKRHLISDACPGRPC
jgi:hypothetical protein